MRRSIAFGLLFASLVGSAYAKMSPTYNHPYSQPLGYVCMEPNPTTSTGKEAWNCSKATCDALKVDNNFQTLCTFGIVDPPK